MKLKENLNELWCNEGYLYIYEHTKTSNQCIFVTFPVMLNCLGILQWWTSLWVNEIHMKNAIKTFCTVGTVKHQNRLPREVLESPSVEIPKLQLDMVLGNLLQLALLEWRGWTRWPREVPSDPGVSVRGITEVNHISQLLLKTWNLNRINEGRELLTREHFFFL